LLFNIAFMVVLTSLLTQGASIGWMARKLGVAMPSASDEEQIRAVFRDFALDPSAPIGSVCGFYGLPAPQDESQPLGVWMRNELRRAPVAGDVVKLGSAEFVVRLVEDGKISSIGLGFPS
jgi:cell volume regulation protein A